MKVTKFPQSCLLIEKSGKKVLIDPGSFVTAKYSVTDLTPVDIILITHEHQDHVDPDLLDKILAVKKVPVVANASTAKLLGDRVTHIVADNETINIEGFEITARELPHVLMTDGSNGPKNTGYVIDKTFFHPGDGLDISDLTVDSVAAPIAGPDISPKDVFRFIEKTRCTTMIPIHYDYFTENPEVFNIPGVNVVILANGESAEI